MADGDKVIGMMDGAYFTGRKEILEWINGTLSIGLTKIEQTATGAVACGLLDAHFPGSVVMSKVNWDCRNEYEYTSNYKTLQAAFNKLNIQKKAEIERLSRGKYQDNLEFMQWFKGFCSNHDVPETYDPANARAKGKGANKVSQVFGTPGTEIKTVKARRHQSSGAMAAEQRGPLPTSTEAAASSLSSVAEKENGNKSAPAPPSSATSSSSSSSSRPPRAALSNSGNNNPTTNTKSASLSTSAVGKQPSSHGSNTAEAAQLQGKLDTMSTQHGELKLHIDGVEKERDFYFEKLRNIEVMLQELGERDAAAAGGEAAAAAAGADKLYGHTPSSLAGQVMKILYDANDDFVAVDNPEDASVGAVIMGVDEEKK
eukprot:CAMPEP_0171762390 /NCGR_PEP_ID=MMETSP0991-20121206/48628_1 /TAXON_ID=483369 /ORGANISM="non described non described, Strain CCMP2098" /LENGTH=370 /DNA_ID=CAMNT_0012365845 /DNA_START=81 /DNA_END=1191 /DNA_ORIENTATION=+